MLASVERCSLGEEHGLQVGDQILLVNGHSFDDMVHSEAAAILKNNDLLIMTIRVSGRIVFLRSKLCNLVACTGIYTCICYLVCKLNQEIAI